LKADPRFLGHSKEFWAHVRTISQEIGYTTRGTKSIMVPTLDQIRSAFAKLSLSASHIADDRNRLTEFGVLLLDYFEFRAVLLDTTVRKNLMDKAAAEAAFKMLRKQLRPKCPLPMNKQKGPKRNHAFLTGIVNMLIEANIGGAPAISTQ
jgi:hypothetical protein